MVWLTQQGDLRSLSPMSSDPREKQATDAELMLAFRRRDTAALEVLYDRFAPQIYRLGLTVLKGPAQAEDLVVDAFRELWRRSERLDPPGGSLETSVLLLALQLALNRFRLGTDRTLKGDPHHV